MISSGSPRSSSEGVVGDGAGGARYARGMAAKKRKRSPSEATGLPSNWDPDEPVGVIVMDLFDAAFRASMASGLTREEKRLAMSICVAIGGLFMASGGRGGPGIGPFDSKTLTKAHDALYNPKMWAQADRDAHAIRIIEMELPTFKSLRSEDERRTEAFRIAVCLRAFVAHEMIEAPVSELVKLFDSFEQVSKGKRGKRNASALYAELLHRFGAAGVDSWGKPYTESKAIRRRSETRLRRRK